MDVVRSNSHDKSQCPIRPQRRQANRTACLLCHKRKIKCDSQTVGFPCTNCCKLSRNDCVPYEKKKRLSPRSAYDPVPIQKAPDEPVNCTQRSKSSPLDENNPSPISNTTLNAKSHASPKRLQNNVPTPRSSFPQEETLGCKKHLVEFIDQEDLSHRPIDKAARLTYLGTDVSNINFLVRQSVQPTIVHHFPTNRLNRWYTAYEPDRIPAEAFQLPDKQLVDALLEAYFEKINPGFPVVDEERFMAQYTARDPADPPSLLLLHSILVAGAHVLPGQYGLKSVSFRRAKILIDSRFEANRDVIVQAALLLTWYSDGAEDVTANAWHWIGFAASTAMGLGMHRDADPSTLVSHNKKMWRRVWWLLVQCDLLVALQYGRPFAINLEDCDVQPPRIEDYRHCGPNTQVDYAIAMTELCIIARSMYRKNFGPLSKNYKRHEALAEADTKLATWSLMLPQQLRLRPTLTLELWPATLHIVYNTVLILLHRPRPHHATPPSPSGIPTSNDAGICSAAAGVVQSIFESLRHRQQISSVWVFGVTALFTTMIQLNVEARFANPLLALAGVRRYDSTLYSMKNLGEYWPNAESILHFFEHSDRLKRKDPQGRVDLTDSSSATNSLHSPTGQPASPDEALEQFPPRQHPSTGGLHQPPTVTDVSPTQSITAEEWRLPYPSIETVDVPGTLGNAFLENWIEMYWQEPPDFGSNGPL